MVTSCKRAKSANNNAASASGQRRKQEGVKQEGLRGHKPATQVAATWVELYDNPRLRYLVGMMADHPEWVESVFIRFLKFFSLAPGESPTPEKHYPPDYFLRWLHRRAVDYRPLKYYYVNDPFEPGLQPFSRLTSTKQPQQVRVFDCLPRVILENSLGRLSKTVVNTDFPMPELAGGRGQQQQFASQQPEAGDSGVGGGNNNLAYDLAQPAGLSSRMGEYLSGLSWWKRGAQFVAARTPTVGKWMSLTFSQEIALAYGDIADRTLWPIEIQELYPAPERPKTLKQAVEGILARAQKSEDLAWLTSLYGPPQADWLSGLDDRD